MIDSELKVVSTLLHPPVSGRTPLARARLIERADALGKGQVAVVTGPAGAGKTTILAQWHSHLRNRGADVAWLSVTALADAFHRFFVQFIAAIQTCRPGFGNGLVEWLESAAGVSADDLVYALAVELSEPQQRRLVIFLDDFHEITLPEIHAAMEQLIRNLPTSVNLVIGARHRPALGLAKLRTEGRLLELDWQDLRFSLSEARAFLDRTDLPLSQDQVTALHERTEGWAAGLQLAALSLAESRDPDAAARAFSGRQDGVADYLMEDVYGRQPESIQQFLRDTSILDRMNAALCNAVCDRTDAAAVLETLDENRLFIFRLDDQRTWYRYHHLFQDFLQTRLLRLEESHRGELYARASRWCEEVGATSEAIDYALRGGLTERAAELLMGYGRILFRAGRFKELRLRAQQIPDDIRARSATLCALEAWAFAYLGDFAAARKCLAEAEAAANTRDSAQGGPLGAELCVLQAALSVIQTDDPGVSGLGPDLAVRLKDADPAVRAFGYVVMAYASRAGGDLGEAEGYLNQAVEISETVGSALVTLLAYFNLGTLDWLRGRPLSVESRLQRAADLAERAHWQHTMGAAFVRVQLGIALHDADRLEEAETELTRAVAILEATQAFGFLGVALVSRASVRWSRGDEDDAEADLENAERLGESRGIPRVLFRASLVRAAMSLARGSLAEVDRLMTDARSRLAAGTTDHPATCDERDEQVALLEIRRELLARRPAPALELAEVVEESAAASGRLRSWIEASALKAEALAALQRWEEAKEALQPALERASPERLIQPFLIAGANLGRVVQSLADSGHPFARLLAASMRRAAKRKSGDALDMQNRERQILALMEQGLSNSEIGERLCLSGETVKWYLKGIYRKLDVHNRTAAITRARDLDLIG